MKTRDIEIAAAQAGINQLLLCSAFNTVLPVLQILARQQGFITRLFLNGFMGAIRLYMDEKCS